MKTLHSVIDRISTLLGRVAEVVVVLLIASMLYEVVARYVFGAPTLWAFDIAYMSTGALFVLGAAQALRQDAHVRIDVLSSRFPARVRGAIDGVAFLFVLGNGHLMLIQAVVRSFEVFQVGDMPLAFLQRLQPQQWGSEIFMLGLWIALPLVGIEVPSIIGFLAAIPPVGIGVPFLLPAIIAGAIGFAIATAVKKDALPEGA